MADRWHGLPVHVVAAGLTDVGRKRDRNEDAILVREDLGLYVVADGAGGHNAGKIASALAIQSITNYFEATLGDARREPSVDGFGLRSAARRLGRAIQKANHDVVEISRAAEEHRGMGSTVVAIAVDVWDAVVHVAHVGDSRCYREREGQLEQLTHDHSLINDVMELRPDIPDAALAKLPRKVVTRALGMEATVRVSVRTFDVADGDTFLLCSDGLSGEVADAGILDALVCDRDPNAAATHLIAMANHAGGSDNIAAIVLRCKLPRQPSSRAAVEPPRGSVVDISEASPASHLLGVEVIMGVDADGKVRTVRLGQGDDQGLFKALGELSRGARAAEPTLPGRTCRVCGEDVLAGDRYCPACGAGP